MRVTRLCLLFLLLYCVTGHAVTLTPAIYFQISGISGDTLKNARASLDSLQKSQVKPPTPSEIQAFTTQGAQALHRALAAFGYYKADVRTRLQHQAGHPVVVFQIQPGPLLNITHLQISILGPGHREAPFQGFLDNFPLKEGQPLQTTAYDNAKQHFYDLAQRLGYLDGKLTTHLIQVDLNRYTATITLVFDTGSRYYFGPVSFGQSPFAERFLRRFIPFQEGHPYSTHDLVLLDNNLEQTLYFRQVTVTPRRDLARDHHVPIEVKMIPSKPFLYTFGAGYGTDTGARASLGFEWRRVTSTGHYLQSVAQVSQVQQNFQVRYVIPGKDPTREHYSLLTGLLTNTPGKGKYETLLGGGNYVKHFGNWLQTITLTYQVEDFTLGNNTPKFRTQFLVPEISWEKVKADDNLNTNRGYRLFFDVKGGQGFTHNNQFIQGQIQGKYIDTFLEDNRFILRGNIGGTMVSKLATLPLSIRFFAGGSRSVRGRNYQSLGPGKYLLIGSAEYQRRIHGNWYVATFFDTGNAFDKTPIHLQNSTGIGVLWRSPLGPFELTLAKPLNHSNPNFIKSLKIQFVMGPDL